MINLLPDIEKKAVEREYKLRRFALFVGMLFFVTVATLLFMLPSYVLALYKGKSPNTQIAKAAAQDQAEEQKSKKEIDTAKLLVKVLQPETNVLLPTKIIDYLVKDKTSANTITGIDYMRSEDGKFITISVRGVAKTRLSLSQFNDAMKLEPGITSVDVPVSNFAKDSNISFTMTITSKLN